MLGPKSPAVVTGVFRSPGVPLIPVVEAQHVEVVSCCSCSFRKKNSWRNMMMIIDKDAPTDQDINNDVKTTDFLTDQDIMDTDVSTDQDISQQMFFFRFLYIMKVVSVCTFALAVSNLIQLWSIISSLIVEISI